MAKQALLSIEQLNVEYPPRRRGQAPIQAVRDVCLQIAPGEIVALVGESGCGKSTLARSVLGLAPVTSGNIRLQGQTMMPPGQNQRRQVQLMFQDALTALSPRRRVAQSLQEPLSHFRICPASEYQARIEQALASVDLDPGLSQRYPVQLSGGQRQRVALARALICEPDLLIADEPVASLDTSVQASVLSLLRRLRDERGLAILFISHDLAVVSQLADSIHVMYRGMVVESGPGQGLLRQPAHPYTQALLKAHPAPDPERPTPEFLQAEPDTVLTPLAGCVFHSRCSQRLERCASEPPIETRVDDDQGQTAPHRTRCHLCN